MTSPRRPSVRLAALSLAWLLAPARADELPVATVVPGAPQASEGAGLSVALAGDVLVAGSPVWDEGREISVGRAHVHRWDGGAWVEQQELLAPTREAYDEFGQSVALTPDGRWLAVGAPGHDDSGTVFVYRTEPGGFVLHQQLQHPGAVAYDHFGHAVALGPDLLLAGAPDRDVPPHSHAGMVYAFRRDGADQWIFEGELDVGTFAAGGGHHGHSLDVDGDTAVVGAPYTPQFSNPFGMVHVLRWDGSDWQRLDSIRGFGKVSTSADFGWSVAIDGQRIAVGAREDDYAGDDQRGSVHLFVEDVGGAWVTEQILGDPAGSSSDRFGTGVALEGGRLVGGAPFAAGTTGGAGVLFERDGGQWVHRGRLLDPTTVTGQIGGAAVLDGGLAALGAPWWDDGTGATGATLVFDLAADPWAWLGQGLTGTLGTPALLPEGELSAGSPGSLSVQGAAPGSAVAFVVGSSALGLPLKGGVLVPAPDVLLFGFSTDGDGQLQLPFTWPGGIPAGLDVFLQAWVTDASGPVGFTASHGLRGTTS